MEGHEVPKNVSEFEFHLVGDMTIKQFAYLGSGLGIAYLIFVIFASLVPIIAYPLILFSILLGAAYAFLPIQERPLDHWTASFFKAIFTPTKRRWALKGVDVNNPAFEKRLEVYLSQVSAEQEVNIPKKPKSSVLSQFVQPQVKIDTPHPATPAAKPAPFLNAPVNMAPPPPQPKPEIKPPQPIQTAPRPIIAPSVPNQANPKIMVPSSSLSPQELSKTIELARQIQIAQDKILQTEKVVKEIKVQATVPGTNPSLFMTQLKQAEVKLQEYEKIVSSISHELATLARTPSLEEKKAQIPVKPVSINLVLTTTPNIINGIVTDAQGNYLEGVVVVTHDKQGLPVRALKTNKLGQFLAATPLPNGTYTISLEKDNLVFDVLEVKLEGEVMSAIRVSAKKGGI